MSSVYRTFQTGRQGLFDPRTSRYRGIALPFNRQANGYFEPKGTRSVIWSSILNILFTPIGQRIMIPEFGSELPFLLFEPNDELLENLARNAVFDAIAKWEPRVRMSDAVVYRDIRNEHRLHLELSYVIIPEQIEDRNTAVISRDGRLSVERLT